MTDNRKAPFAAGAMTPADRAAAKADLDRILGTGLAGLHAGALDLSGVKRDRDGRIGG